MTSHYDQARHSERSEESLVLWGATYIDTHSYQQFFHRNLF